VVVLGVAGGGYLWWRDSERRQVWVASADFPAYRQLSRTDVRLAWVRASALPRDPLSKDAVVLGRYSLAAAGRGKALSAAAVGPALPVGSLQGRSVVSLSASAADIGGALVARGGRIDVLLSSTATEEPRSGVMNDAIVLDVRPLGGQPDAYIVVLGVPASSESVLLAAGGTAKMFFVRAASASP
jgi:Flp pilus assembly protein CpaB